ncbi:ParB/RepB/Spo0J family partition protein [Oscillospiraceae bacterium MB08-C2-2]|nr:ParB/RepB/Spo0J family partition protein [Oscillospiraceae bacterium MB08-C2-2]
MTIPMLTKRNKEINRVVMLPLEKIVSNRAQPRKYFEQGAIEELAASIQSNGLLQPVTVRKTARGDYELIAGERRTRAYRFLGRESIPAIVEEMDDSRSAALALVENLQRMDLHYLEEAAGIAALMEQEGLTQQQVAAKLGKAQSTVANKLRLLKLDNTVCRQLLEANMGERHARALLKLENPELRQKAARHMARNALTVEQSEKYIEGLMAQAAKPKGTRLYIVKDIRLFLNTIEKAVGIMRQAGISVDSQTREESGYLEIVVRVPRGQAYQRKEPPMQQLSIL